MYKSSITVLQERLSEAKKDHHRLISNLQWYMHNMPEGNWAAQIKREKELIKDLEAAIASLTAMDRLGLYILNSLRRQP